ncbi:unnamed protein product [Schistosoma spindalis]|nr:unnamed protein product [Schistosoma spindale]
MNDLLALILYVIKDEEDSFWCFVGLMNRLESNFNGELNAVREQFNQLFSLIEIFDPTFSEYLESKSAKEMPFCFRWLLIHFKREFSYKDTMTLWEGIENDLKPIVWKYLLGYYQWTYTAEENERLKVEKSREYHILKTFLESMSPDGGARFSLFRGSKCFIDKDVPRTDRKTDFYSDDSHGNLTRLSDILITYTIYNMDFGYFQGMNDLLALILYVIKDEEDSFWCFVGLMNRLESNFNGELNAVREQFNQLFSLIEIFDPTFSEYLESKSAKEMPFCFRWLLIHFKREFSYKDTMTLWEAFWTDYRTKNFHIFFAAAILLTQRDNIMNRKYDANSILKVSLFYNNKSSEIIT